MDALYYESHVTIDPISEEELYKLDALQQMYGFKRAKLYMDKACNMVKSDMDEFMTAHSRSYDDLYQRMSTLIAALTFHNFKVRRGKIEAVLYDTREYKG